jgi:hypothetical protein
MTRLLVHVEGQTEETFVNEILGPYLYSQGYIGVSARLLGNTRQRNRRGGIRAWSVVKKEILNHLKEDPQCIATTMVDYYGLPQDGDKSWPGRAKAGQVPFAEKAACVEQALSTDLASTLGVDFETRRFVPFVTMHEFEGLLFSDCRAFGTSIGRADLLPSLQKIRDEFSTPEEINDSPDTAPSKRIEQLVQNYEKPFFGTVAALTIGLDKIQKECPHFRDWLARLTACLGARN